MKKRVTVGYIFCDKEFKEDEKAFMKIAKKKKINLVFFNIAKEISEEEIEEKAKQCNIIFNNSAEEFAIEFVKTLEELGKKVIESSEKYYRSDDKWLFFLKCKENKVPTPETILLSENIVIAEKELKEFGRWPVVLKRIEGCTGEYVERAENIKEAVKILERFWNKGSERLPVIAQEFIKSKSYRVTLIDGKVVQTATKDNTGWKSTGVYQKKHHKFKVDKNLKKICEKITKASGINVCGVDLMNDNGKWKVIEVNSQPAFDFFPNEREKLIGKVFDLLIKKARKK